MRQLTRLCLSIVCVVATSIAARSAHAQTQNNAQARRLYQSGERAYEAGRYEEALQYFEQTYALSHRPELLYNIGRAAEEGGNRPRAMEAYQQYMSESDASGQRSEHARHDEVQGRLEVLRNLAAASNPRMVAPISIESATQPTTLPIAAIQTPPTDNHSVTDEGWFWPVTLGGSALLVGGAVLAIVLLTSNSGVPTGDDGLTHTALTAAPQPASAPLVRF